MTHKVGKITLELTANSYQYAQNQQQQAGNWVNNTLPIILQNTFDKISPNASYVFLDKIEINVPAEPWLLADSYWEKLILENIKTPENEENIVKKILNELHFFLQKGYISKNMTFANFKEYEKFFSDKLAYFINFLEEKWLGFNFQPAYFQRFLAGFSVVFLQKILQKIVDLNIENTKRFLKIIIVIQEKCPQKLPELFNYIFTEKKKINNMNFLQIESRVQEFKAGKTELNYSKKKHRKEKIEAQNIRNENEGIMAPNAGLVILFPYLNSFFEAVGLVDNGAFVNEKSKILAIQALYYLATGKRKAIESELVMPKILVDLPIESFIKIKTNLPKYIADEAEELLNDIRQNWTELSGSSNETMRQSFLQRTGQIYLEPALITIKMENSGIDVLLGRIPWGFRHFKLLWMQQTVVTEWY